MDLMAYALRIIQTVPEVIPYLGGAYKTYDYFLARIEGLVRGVYSGNIAGDFIDVMSNLISGQLLDAYEKAYFDEGYTDALPDYLNVAYQEAVAAQYGFVDQFYRDITDARIDKTSVDPLMMRAGMWANRWNEAYNEAVRLITLQGGGNMIWQYGEAEHCETCRALHGIVARASEWDQLGVKPQNAPNNLLECGGWNCQCALTPTKQRRSPDAYGRIEAAIFETKSVKHLAGTEHDHDQQDHAGGGEGDTRLQKLSDNATASISRAIENKKLLTKDTILIDNDIDKNTLASPYNSEVNAISINPKLLDDEFMGNFAKEWDGLMIDPSRNGVITHELAHALQNQLSNNYPNEWREIKLFIGDRWETDYLNGASRSFYAQENAMEWFAEAVTDVSINGDKASNSSKELVDLINNLTR